MVNDYVAIGTVKVLKSKVVRHHFDYAAWYVDIEIKPGTYELRAKLNNGKVQDWPGVWSPLEGTVVDEHTGAYLAGVCIKASPKEYVGKPWTWYFTMYAHAAAWLLLGYRDKVLLDDDPWFEIQLNPGFEARLIEWVSKYDGQPHQTAGIFAVEPTMAGTR